MERRLAIFLFAENGWFTFMDSENYNQHAIPSDFAKMDELDLRDGCEVFLIFDREENLVGVELARPARDLQLLRELYEAVTKESFSPEYIKALRRTPAEMRHIAGANSIFHRAVYIYRRDPVAMVVEFRSSNRAHTAFVQRRCALASLVLESPFPDLWRPIFEPTNLPYHGPYGDVAEAAYRGLG